MSSENPITDALRKMLAEVDAETGKTHWERLMEVVQQKADSGDAQFAKLLKRAKAIEAANPHYTSGGQEASE